MKRIRWTPQIREQFVNSLSRTGIVSAAAKCIGLSPRRAYELKAMDSEFSKAWDKAEEMAWLAMRQEVKNRTLSSDCNCERKRKRAAVIAAEDGHVLIENYSDRLLAFLLRKYNQACESKMANPK